MLTTTKQCKYCNTTKNTSSFATRKDTGNTQNKCKECTYIYMKEYRTVNSDAILKNRTLNKENINKNRVSSDRKYRDNNKAKIKEIGQKYRQTEKGRTSHLNSEAKRRHLIKTKRYNLPMVIRYPLTKELQNLLIQQNNQCNNCNIDLSENKHLDHHVPLSKGGTHSIDNVVWLCRACNLKKSASMPTKLLLI